MSHTDEQERLIAKLQLRVMELESKVRRADNMAACVDILIHRRVLGSRSLVGDARLQYGDPFTREEAEALMLETRSPMERG